MEITILTEPRKLKPGLWRKKVRNKPFMPQNPSKAQNQKTPGSSEEVNV